jgi:hypothetical protein
MMFVEPSFACDLDRHEMVGEGTSIGGLRCATMTLDAESIELRAGHAPPAHRKLCGRPLGKQVAFVPRERALAVPGAETRSRIKQRTEIDPAHRFRSAADREIVLAAAHALRGEVDRLLAGAALPVNSGGRDILRQPRPQGRPAADIARLGECRVLISIVHLTDRKNPCDCRT